MLLLIIGVTIQHLIQQRRATIADAGGDLMRLDQVIAEHTSHAVEAIDAVLQEVAGHPDRQGFIEGEGLRRLIDGTPQLLGLVLTDAGGTVLARTARLSPAIIADYLAHRPPAGARMVGSPFRDAEGRWSVPLVRSLDDRAGTLAAFLDLGYFHDFYHAVDPSEEGAIVLHRLDGLVLARYPRAEAAVGTSYASLPLFSDALATGTAAGTTIAEVPGEAGERIIAVRRLHPFPLAISVSASLDSVLTPWQAQAGTILLTGLAAAGVIGALLLMLASESRRVEALLADSARARAAAEAANTRLTEQMDERERTEAALRQAQRLEAVGQLTGGVAHDFNNLLTVLLGNIDLIQATVEGADHALATRIERMRSAAERGAQLTDQLLAFARRQPLMARPTSLNVVVAGMNDLVQSAMGGNIRVVLRLQEDPWLALVDTTQIELVILNLAINARDAMAKGGTLTIETANVSLSDVEPDGDLPTGSYVVVRVSDTGIGMSAEVAAKAFEPFFTTKAPGQGSGLGLSQVYGLARQSGGAARIDSAPGRGTCVSVFLPRAANNADGAGRGARPAVPRVSTGARILLVDDDEAVRITTAMILESLGYVIETAIGGVPALDRLGDPPAAPCCDLLLTDVAMPGMNGPELADRVRARFPDLPIVFFSGYADPAAIAGRQILQRMVRKPFRAIDLAAQIEAALAERASAVP
jgi:signal transduction histidine kinase/ActR/RegA family two-component response regulator